MGNVVLLDDNTINKIAAGEVIEKPANVVKELVENSIDAKATTITIEIANGGIKLIRVIDNGMGIREDDTQIAFERHATSKIRSADDLAHVLSMGFRGEALASIASVAQVTLLTHNKDEQVGTKLVVKGGNILENSNVGHPIGTSITVENLFFNTPARYKFLKKDYTEAGYIEDNIVRLALANPNISFKYINNGKLVFQTLGNNDIKGSIYSIFGKDISQNLIEIDDEYENINIKGVIGNNKIARSNRNNQMFYINKRYIKDRILSSAIDEAFRTIIPQGKFAFCVLNIDINPELVDINVHPAKLEARFQDESMMYRCIFHIVKNAIIGNNNETPFTSIQKEGIADTKSIDINNTKDIAKSNTYTNNTKRLQLINQESKEDTVLYNLNKLNASRKESLQNEYNIQETEKEKQESKDMYTSNKQDIKNIETYSVKEQESIYVLNEKREDAKKESEIKTKKLDYIYIGVAFNTYIIIQIEDDIYLIDQHAAHERVIYERLLEKSVNNKSESQMLLIPSIITLTNKEKEIVIKNIEKFEEVGYIIEDFGDNTIKLSAVPNLDMDIDYDGMFKDIIDEIQGIVRTGSAIQKERFMYTVACKAAVKAKMHLSIDEIKILLDEMMSLNSPFTCPHGRPTAIKMSKYEIERKFLRK